MRKWDKHTGRDRDRSNDGRSTIANWETQRTKIAPEDYCDWLDKLVSVDEKNEIPLRELRFRALEELRPGSSTTGAEVDDGSGSSTTGAEVDDGSGSSREAEPDYSRLALDGRGTRTRARRVPAVLVLVGLVLVGLIVAGLVAGLGLFSDSSAYNVREDFSDPGSGWKRSDDADELAAYSNGQYRLVLKRSGLAFSSAPASLTRDLPRKVKVAVRVTQMPGATGSVGVFCRMNAGLQYAGLLDTATRRWKIGKVSVKGQPVEELLPGTTGPLRENTNDIALECSGSESSGAPVVLRLLINGTEVGTKVDPIGLPPGQVGVEVITGGNQPVGALFDDFAVSAL